MEGLLAHLEQEPRDQGVVNFERHPGANPARDLFCGVWKTSGPEGAAAVAMAAAARGEFPVPRMPLVRYVPMGGADKVELDPRAEESYWLALQS